MPWPVDPDPRRLRSFLVLAEELHFGRASQRLSIVQSTLSHHIRRLEDDLGVALFVRTTRHVALTPAGTALARDARAPLAELRAAVDLARAIGLGRAGTLRVGFVGSGANELTPPILARFAARAPDVEVVLHSVAISDPTAGLLSDTSDVAFVRDFRGHRRLVHEVLLEEPRVYVLPAGHRLAARAGLREVDLSGEPTIALVPDLGPDVAEAWRERTRSPDRPVGGRASSIDTWLALVAAGRGITSAPASTARFFARPGLAFVPALDAEPSVVSVAWRADAQSPLVEAFVACALEASGPGPRRPPGAEDASSAAPPRPEALSSRSRRPPSSP